jgi:transposase InsO family protein
MLSALERHVAQSGEQLAETQVAAWEMKQDDQVAHGEIETTHRLTGQPVHVLCWHPQGRICPQTFVDTYFKEAAATDCIRPEADRCGRPQQYDDPLSLALNQIAQTKSTANAPQPNGICERFYNTILNAFYQVAFSDKLYRTIEELQADLDDGGKLLRHLIAEFALTDAGFKPGDC